MKAQDITVGMEIAYSTYGHPESRWHIRWLKRGIVVAPASHGQVIIRALDKETGALFFPGGGLSSGERIRLGEARPGDLLLIVADEWMTTCEVLGQLRNDIGRPPVHEGPYRYLWVVDFPLFVGVDETTGRPRPGQPGVFRGEARRIHHQGVRTGLLGGEVINSVFTRAFFVENHPRRSQPAEQFHDPPAAYPGAENGNRRGGQQAVDGGAVGGHGQRRLRVPSPASAHIRLRTQKRSTTLVSGQPCFWK